MLKMKMNLYLFCEQKPLAPIVATPSGSRLVNQNERAITLQIFLRKIIEQTAAFSYHLEQSALPMMILRILLKMGCERIDVRGEDRDLYFRATRILGSEAELRGKFGLLFCCYWHE